MIGKWGFWGQYRINLAISYSSPNRWYIILHVWHTLVTKKSIDIYRGDLLLICIRCFGQTCRQKPHQADKKRDRERVCVHVSLCTCKCLCTLQFVYQCIPTVLTLSGTESVLTVRAMQPCMEFIMTSFYIWNKLKKNKFQPPV